MMRILLLLCVLLHAHGAVNALASGNPVLNSAMAFTGSQYISLGQPTALTSVLIPSHEFTIILRKARTTPTSTGYWIGQANSTTSTFGLYSQGGSSETGSIGGVTFGTGSGTVKYGYWNTVALRNHNVSGTFMGSVVIDGDAGSTEVAVGSQVAAVDIMIGARRNTTNADAAVFLSGNEDGIAIYDYYLTDNQVHSAMGYLNPQEVMTSVYMGTDFSVGLVAYFPGNEASGLALFDTVQGLTGTANVSGIFGSSNFSHKPIQLWGDSLTVGAGGTQSYGQDAVDGSSGLRNGRTVQVNGYSGMNVAYIATQQAITANQAYFTWTQLYEVGVHDLTNISGVQTFLQNSIAALPHNRWLFAGLTPYGVGTGSGPVGSAGPQDWGTTGSAGRNTNDAMNLAMRSYTWTASGSTYSCAGRFCDWQNVFVTLAVSPPTNDTFQLRMPYQIVSAIGAPHPVDAGYLAVSQAEDIQLRQLDPTW